MAGVTEVVRKGNYRTKWGEKRATRSAKQVVRMRYIREKLSPLIFTLFSSLRNLPVLFAYTSLDEENIFQFKGL